MPAFPQSFRNFLPAETGLTGSVRPNLHKTAPGTLSLVRNFRQEGGPRGVGNALGQKTPAQTLDVQLFGSDQSIVVDEPVGNLVLEIVA